MASLYESLRSKLMNLGAFSLSLAVKDLDASLAFYKKLGFEPLADMSEQGWAILKNGEHVIGLFGKYIDGPIGFLGYGKTWCAIGNDFDSTGISDCLSAIL